MSNVRDISVRAGGANAVKRFRRGASRSARVFFRQAYASLSQFTRYLHRKQFALATSRLVTRDPTVFFCCPDFDQPAGGVRVIYRHVDILNSAGIRAFVMHRKQGFRCSWFENVTPIVAQARVQIEPRDVIVIPETEADLLSVLPVGLRYVIFNQNSHLTWTQIDSESGALYTSDPDLAAVITVSTHNEEMLRYAFNGCPVRRIRLSVDPVLFYPSEDERPRRLTYMPRRGRSEAAQVIAMLRGRGVFDRWDLQALDGLPHSGVAQQLRTSRIFLAFTGQEGFGLPAAEAMACGNYVIGNHGFGGREFFNEDFSVPIESGDVVGFARAVEEAIRMETQDHGWCERKGRQAASFISSTYGLDQEREDVIRTYVEILNGSRQASC
ncbi:MAG TPA: glycosyltransferase [Rhizobiaceae bacterium]